MISYRKRQSKFRSREWNRDGEAAWVKEARYWKLEIARRMLTARHCGDASNLFSKALRSEKSAAHQRMWAANLVGFGFGAKETSGSITGDICIRVYVSAKKAKRHLTMATEVPGDIAGMPTDIVVAEDARVHSRANPGSAIRRAGPPGNGTLGIIVEKDGSDKWFLLSAAHVLAPNSNAAAGDDVLLPGDANPLATLVNFVPLVRNGQSNQMDAALAEIKRKTDVATEVEEIGRITNQVVLPKIFQSVRKFGAASSHTLGIVVDPLPTITLQAVGGALTYSEQITVNGCGGSFSVAGDSGSLVVDALTSAPIGLLVGGAGFQSYVTPLESILSKFGVKPVI